MISPVIFTLFSGAFTVVCTVGSGLAQHIMVSTRHQVRLEQLERENAEFKAQFRTLPQDYVPRNEITVQLHHIKEMFQELKSMHINTQSTLKKMSIRKIEND